MADEDEVAQVEEEARKMGWVPKEKFRGGEDKWVDAQTFVDKGKNMIPLLKENIERMSSKYGAIESELKDTKKTISEFVDYAKKGEERAYERAKKQYEKEIATLKAQMKSAVRAGDSDTYEQLESRIESLEPPEKPEPKVEPKQDAAAPVVETPELKAWKDENPWFLTDRKMAKFAIAIEGEVAAENPGKSQADLLKIIADEVKSRFPEKFENTNRKKDNTVDTGSSEGRRNKPGKHSFDDLPDDAKKAYKKFAEVFKSAGKEYSKEDYLKNYEWDEEE